MKAIILVAGYATRLYPLTLKTPKALLCINNKPIIDYIVDEINTIDDVTEIFVVSNHKFAQNFMDWSKQVTSKIPVVVLDDGTVDEATRRGAIGDIAFAVDEENIDEDVMIIAGDNFFTYKLKDAYAYFRKIDKDCVLGKELDDVEQLKAFAVAQLDENNKLIDLVEKPEVPKSNIAVYATYFYKRDTLKLVKKYLQDGNKPDAPGYLVQWLYTRQDVYVYKFNGECYDIGTKKALDEVGELYKDR